MAQGSSNASFLSYYGHSRCILKIYPRAYRRCFLMYGSEREKSGVDFSAVLRYRAKGMVYVTAYLIARFSGSPAIAC